MEYNLNVHYVNRYYNIYRLMRLIGIKAAKNGRELWLISSEKFDDSLRATSDQQQFASVAKMNM